MKMGRSTYHLIVLLRLGWLTVLSSRNIVEQELNFFVRSPGDICYREVITHMAPV